MPSSKHVGRAGKHRTPPPDDTLHPGTVDNGWVVLGRAVTDTTTVVWVPTDELSTMSRAEWKEVVEKVHAADWGAARNVRRLYINRECAKRSASRFRNKSVVLKREIARTEAENDAIRARIDELQKLIDMFETSVPHTQTRLPSIAEEPEPALEVLEIDDVVFQQACHASLLPGFGSRPWESAAPAVHDKSPTPWDTPAPAAIAFAAAC